MGVRPPWCLWRGLDKGRTKKPVGAMTKLELQTRLAGLHRDLDSLAGLADARVRGLQLAARGLRQAESTAQWVQILADAAAPLAAAMAFFRVDRDSLRCEAARGMDVPVAEIPLADGPAFRQAVDTRETVVSLFEPAQLGGMGEVASRRRAHLFPLVGKTRVLGVLLALDDPALDTYGLELLLSLAAASLELREAPAATMIGVAPAAALPPSPATARGFARTTVARWILELGNAVAAGRARADLYGEMQTAIDEARGAFGARYQPGPDYLHEEIVARLALGRVSLLGPAYPGAMGGGGHA